MLDGVESGLQFVARAVASDITMSSVSFPPAARSFIANPNVFLVESATSTDTVVIIHCRSGPALRPVWMIGDGVGRAVTVTAGPHLPQAVGDTSPGQVRGVPTCYGLIRYAWVIVSVRMAVPPVAWTFSATKPVVAGCVSVASKVPLPVRITLARCQAAPSS